MISSQEFSNHLQDLDEEQQPFCRNLKLQHHILVAQYKKLLIVDIVQFLENLKVQYTIINQKLDILIQSLKNNYPDQFKKHAKLIQFYLSFIEHYVILLQNNNNAQLLDVINTLINNLPLIKLYNKQKDHKFLSLTLLEIQKQVNDYEKQVNNIKESEFEYFIQCFLQNKLNMFQFQSNQNNQKNKFTIMANKVYLKQYDEHVNDQFDPSQESQYSSDNTSISNTQNNLKHICGNNKISEISEIERVSRDIVQDDDLQFSFTDLQVSTMSQQQNQIGQLNSVVHKSPILIHKQVDNQNKEATIPNKQFDQDLCEEDLSTNQNQVENQQLNHQNANAGVIVNFCIKVKDITQNILIFIYVFISLISYCVFKVISRRKNRKQIQMKIYDDQLEKYSYVNQKSNFLIMFCARVTLVLDNIENKKQNQIDTELLQPYQDNSTSQISDINNNRTSFDSIFQKQSTTGQNELEQNDSSFSCNTIEGGFSTRRFRETFSQKIYIQQSEQYIFQQLSNYLNKKLFVKNIIKDQCKYAPLSRQMIDNFLIIKQIPEKFYKNIQNNECLRNFVCYQIIQDKEAIKEFIQIQNVKKQADWDYLRVSSIMQILHYKLIKSERKKHMYELIAYQKQNQVIFELNK